MASFNLDNYVPVHERIERFYGSHPNGRINTDIVNQDGGLVIIRAAVYRERDDAEPSATGHAYEIADSSYINKTSYIENCETSAIGRALANLGIEISRGIASRSEMEKVQRMTEKPALKVAPSVEAPTNREVLAREIQVHCKALNASGDSIKWTKKTLDEYIVEMFGDGINSDTANEKQMRTVADDLNKRAKAMKEAA